MFEPLLISFREAFQCSLIAAIILLSPAIRDKRNSFNILLSGILAAFISGFLLGYIPHFSKSLLRNETWTFYRYVMEALTLYAGIFLAMRKADLPDKVLTYGLFAAGFLIFFFEARATGFIVYDIGLMKEDISRMTFLGLAGIVSGLMPLFIFSKFSKGIKIRDTLSLPGLFISIGALNLAFGGVGEVEEGDLLIAFQRGVMAFTGGAVKKMQSALMIQEHPFIEIPFSELAIFLSGDRIAMSLAVIFIMAPPLFVLIHLVSRPDPIVNGIRVSAQKRLKVAIFRKELIYEITPVLAAFFLIFFQFHASNISFNPLYEPAPITVRESENRGLLVIPLSDRLGDFSDRKMRKYVYYYGNKQILFLAVLKPDGSAGLALDQCEICRPADWNKAAQGYAQKGDNLICKYCVTPIALPTINKPGGCNPIPVPFRMEDRSIVITLDDLTKTFKYAETLDKKGTHF